MKSFKQFFLENYEIDLYEAVEVDKKKYSWGKMITVRHGASHSFPLHPEHQEKIKSLKDGESTSFTDETRRKVKAHREGNTVHLQHADSNTVTPVSYSHFTEEVDLDESSNREYIKSVLSRHLNNNRVAHKVTSSVGYDKFQIGPKTHISHDGQGLSVHHNGEEVGYFSSPRLDYKKAAAAAQKLTEESLKEELNLRITKVYNKFPKKATYAVHTPDRKYFKEFDSEDAAKKHLETKK